MQHPADSTTMASPDTRRPDPDRPFKYLNDKEYYIEHHQIWGQCMYVLGIYLKSIFVVMPIIVYWTKSDAGL